MSVTSQLGAIRNSLPPQVTLVAVSKMHPAALALEAYQAGQRDFGENKVQELLPKYHKLPKDIRWHLIGHLQTNKVKLIAPFIHMIQSVDSIKLLEVINREAKKNNRSIPCLIQVHIAQEESKFGFPIDQAKDLLLSADLSPYPNVKLSGLMGMASLTSNMDQVYREFSSLQQLFTQIQQSNRFPKEQFNTLSMGMTSDFQLAVKAGSNMVRIGSAIFGLRNYNQAN